jgi:hypothetical protein
MRIEKAAGLAVMGIFALATVLPAQTTFDPLFRVTDVKGVCLVKKSDASTSVPAINEKAYPFGTVIQTGEGGKAVVRLSVEDILVLAPFTELTVFAADDADSNRVVHLTKGEVQIVVREDLTEKGLVVETPVASGEAFHGRCTINSTPAKDGAWYMTVTTADGSLRVVGPQFAVPKIKGGSVLKLLSTEDRGMTMLVNGAGDYKMEFPNGTDTPVTIDTSTHSSVRIWREHAPVGGKMVVSVFVVGSNGKGKENFSFVAGEPLLAAESATTTPDLSATGSVSTITAVLPGAGTNAPVVKKEESIF